MGLSCPCGQQQPHTILEGAPKTRLGKNTEKSDGNGNKKINNNNNNNNNDDDREEYSDDEYNNEGDYSYNNNNNNNNNNDDDDDDEGTVILGGQSRQFNEINIMDETNNKESIYKSWRDALLDGNTALLEWYTQEHPELNLFNYEFPDGSSSLSKAIQKKLYLVVHNLISEGADVNHVNPKTGNTPLHEAVFVDNLKLVTFLLKDKEVDDQIKNNDGMTPYDLAKEANNPDLMELLEPELQVTTIAQPSKPKNALEELGELVGESVSSNDRDNELTAVGGHSASAASHNALIEKSKTADYDNHSEHSQSSKSGVITQSLTDVGTPSPSDNKRDMTDADKAKDFTGNKGYYEQLQKNVKPKVGADNPFNRRLKKTNTRAVLEQMEIIHQEQAKLPVLEAFLEKKQPRAPYSWQKRWVVVKHGHILWSDKQREINDASQAQERHKFNGQVSIMHINELGPIKTRSGNKFYIVANTDKRKKRRFEFKTVSEQDRDFWLKGIEAHIAHEKKMIQYLEQNA